MSNVDLVTDAILFSTSVKLTSAATGIQKILDGIPPTAYEQHLFPWVADLFRQIDWQSGYTSAEHPEHIVLATRLRPLFYQKQLALLHAQCTVPSFAEVYTTLKSYTANRESTPPSLDQFQKIISSMADDLLSRSNYSNI